MSKKEEVKKQHRNNCVDDESFLLTLQIIRANTIEALPMVN